MPGGSPSPGSLCLLLAGTRGSLLAGSRGSLLPPRVLEGRGAVSLNWGWRAMWRRKGRVEAGARDRVLP